MPKLPKMVFGSTIELSLLNPFDDRFNSYKDLKKLMLVGKEVSSLEASSRRWSACSLPSSAKCAAGTLL